MAGLDYVPDEEAMAVDRCIAALPGDLRQAVILRYQQGLTHAMVGRRLGNSERTVRRWIAMAHQLLAPSLHAAGVGGKPS